MKNSTLIRVGVALVTCAAAASIMISQGAFAQGGAPETSFAPLLGRGAVRCDDERFQPLAMLVLDEATPPDSAALKGNYFIDRTVTRHVFDHYLVVIPGSRVGRGESPRSLTPSEAVLLEELFSQDLHKAKSAEITKNGLSGTIRPEDASIKADTLFANAKVRAEAKSKWYGEGAKGLGPS